MSAVTRSLFMPAVLVFAAAALTGCDRYVEQASLRPDGTIAFLAEADLICSDPLQNAVFGEDPCALLETVAAGGESESTVGPVVRSPVDPNDIEFEITGDRDRRRILARWEGPRREFASLLVSGVTVLELDDERTEATFSTIGAPADELGRTDDPDVLAELPRSRWAIGEFRAIAPALVVEHNGDRQDGRTVIWEFDGDVPESLTMTWSIEARSFRLWWWLVGAVILSGVLAGLVLTNRPQTSRPASSDPSTP